jgi:hypothetical protein
MIRRFSMAALALLVAAPLAAQGFQVRVDASTNAADPDDVPEVTVEAKGANAFQVTTGPAAVVWNPANTATGEYTLSARFTLMEPSGHNNYYGLVFGGGALDADSQNYLYFLIGQNGTYILKHRAGNDTVHDIVGRTPHDAIIKPGASGSSVNTLAVRVGATETQFVINGSVVHTAPRSGMAARTDGIYGVRVNHRIPGVLVEGLSVSN